MCLCPSTTPGRGSTSTSFSEARWISAKLRICACANLMSSIVCGATLATRSSISSRLSRNLGGDHLSNRSESSRTAASPRSATSAMMLSTVPRIFASTSSCWPANAAFLMCRGILPPTRVHHGDTEVTETFSGFSCLVVENCLPSRPAAIDEQARPGDQRGGRRGEKHDRRGDLFDRTDPAHRYMVEDPFSGCGIVEEGLRQWSRDKGRRDGDDTHTLGRQFDRHRLGPPFDA